MTDDFYQPDIQKLCNKFNLNRHDFIMILAEICRLKGCTPKQLLYILEDVQDLEAYIIQLKFKKSEDELSFD